MKRQNYCIINIILSLILQIGKCVETNTAPLEIQAIKQDSLGERARREFKVSKGVWCLLDQIYFLEKHLIKKIINDNLKPRYFWLLVSFLF